MLLISLFFLLFLGIVGFLFIPSKIKLFMRQYSLGITSLVFVVSLFLWLGFDQSTSKFQFVVDWLWLPLANINLTLGVDGISLFFVPVSYTHLTLPTIYSV